MQELTVRVTKHQQKDSRHDREDRINVFGDFAVREKDGQGTRHDEDAACDKRGFIT